MRAYQRSGRGLRVEKVWFGVSVAASIATLVLFFLEGARHKSRRGRIVRFAVHTLLVVFVVFAVVQWQQNRALNDIKEQAARFADRYENLGSLQEQDDATLYGIVTGGLAFLDKYSDELGDTHRDAQALYRTLLRDIPEPTDEFGPNPRHDRLVEAAGAMLGIISSVEDEEPEWSN